MTRRRRALTADEIALWTHVTKEVDPLVTRRRAGRAATMPPEPDPPAGPADAARPPPPPMPKKPGRARPAPAPEAPRPPPLTPLAPLDRHERRRLARGTRAIDGRIDLHGMRQAEAHGALRGFLAHAQLQGFAVVLVITGKGRDGAPGLAGEERGVLRRVVPQWLRMAALRPLVVGFEEAHQGHGGGGALYVRLRRARRGPAA